MRIACVGGGPGGLMAALLLKRDRPSREITVYEGRQRNAPAWGVVLPDPALAILRDNDEDGFQRLRPRLRRWERIDCHRGDTVVSCAGHPLSGVGRTALVDTLSDRAIESGIDLRHGQTIHSTDALKGFDLVVAAPGAGNRLRTGVMELGNAVTRNGSNRFVWLGLDRPSDAFSFIFAETRWGWFQAHIYPYDERYSTIIIETTEAAWRASGLAEAGSAEALTLCSGIFRPWLHDAPLLAGEGETTTDGGAGSPALRWRGFTAVSPRHLVGMAPDGPAIAVVGDAAHAIHFSIGVGTRLAFEDACGLRDALRQPDLRSALDRYESERLTATMRLQSAARNSSLWFEDVARYGRMGTTQFAYSLLTRSQRLGHAELKKRDPAFVARHESWLAGVGASLEPPKGGAVGAGPPLALPFQLRGMRLVNRIVVSPMAMYSARDGAIGDFHLVHLGARALGGAGLLMTEMTAVSAEARITPGCAGLYRPEHEQAWQRVVDFVHTHSEAKICLQLGHAGPKGATKRGWEGMGEPLAPKAAWPLAAASDIPWDRGHQRPAQLDRAGMNLIRDQFVSATRAAASAGFDMLELHAAHGYLLSSFLTPLTNRRDDLYGGSLAARLRYPLEVFAAMQAAWPADRPFSVRISAHDWVEGGIEPDDAVGIARAFERAGADLIDVSAGQTSPHGQPVYGRMFQTPFSDRIRNEVPIATMAVGNITDADQINTIIAAGRADLCALGRPHLADPHFSLRALSEAAETPVNWPKQYRAAETLFRRLAPTPTLGGGV